jgi:hypothetical protein
LTGAGERGDQELVRALSLARAVLYGLGEHTGQVEGTRWDQPIGLLGYAFLFVAPFTVVGSFAILWPVHWNLSRYDDRFILWCLTSLVAGISGAAMLGLLRADWKVFVVGALCGLCTAAVWLVAFHLASAASGKVQ